ncbi:hypothetical protein EJB05_57516, partial [Eragrostis curvula]
MSAEPQLLAAGFGRLSRSASGILVKAATGFHVFRVDGYSWSKTFAAGERISSEKFSVGGDSWYVDYYPNGAESSKDSSDYISLHLRLSCDGDNKYHARAQYKFSLLDHAGNAAYERPAETSTFTYAGRIRDKSSWCRIPEGSGCGIAEFIRREELERRSESLLQDDCLAIRCDVGVAQQEYVGVAPKQRNCRHDDDDDDEYYREGSPEGRRRRRQPLDDVEYIRQCLVRRPN